MRRSEVISAANIAVREYNDNLWAILGGMQVPGVKYPMDPWLFSLIMGGMMSAAGPDEMDAMRGWGIDQWSVAINGEIEHRAVELGIDPAAATDPDVPPAWLSPSQGHAYRQARERSGELIHGLGNHVSEATGEIVAEAWDATQLTMDADAEARKRNLDLLSEEMSEAIARGGTAEEVALEMGRQTGDWGRDWLRIARTEMQGVHNEGAAMEALEMLGPEAMVARVPDVTACTHCRRLFVSGGIPIVFPVKVLIDNGTNAGRKSRDWVPTLWPIHPNCRCGVQVVPPGFTMDAEWDLSPLEEVA